MGTICSKRSAAVSRDIWTVHGLANTVAHELGHNIGFVHYNEICDCTLEGPCVMDTVKPNDAAAGFASCTTADYNRRVGE